jgi:hypothetical protein
VVPVISGRIKISVNILVIERHLLVAGDLLELVELVQDLPLLEGLEQLELLLLLLLLLLLPLLHLHTLLLSFLLGTAQRVLGYGHKILIKFFFNRPLIKCFGPAL